MKKMVIAIIILSAFDAVCTAIGVSDGEVIEANPLFVPSVMSSPWVSCALICLAVCACMWLIYHFGKKIKWVNYGVIAILLERIAIATVHIVGIAYII